MNSTKRTLIIYSRKSCDLCQIMQDAVKPWQSKYKFALEIIDIEYHPKLIAQFAARIPLLVEGDKEICQYYFEERRLLKHFKDTD